MSSGTPVRENGQLDGVATLAHIMLPGILWVDLDPDVSLAGDVGHTARLHDNSRYVVNQERRPRDFVARR